MEIKNMLAERDIRIVKTREELISLNGVEKTLVQRIETILNPIRE